MDSIRPGPLPAPAQPVAEVAELRNLRVDRPTRFNDAIVAAAMAFVHGLGWLPTVIALLSFVPKHKKTFADFGMKLPWLTEIMIDLSDEFVELFPVLPLIGLAFMGLDAWLLYALRRKSRTLSWLWFLFVLLVCGFSFFVTWMAVWLPITELMEGLSR
jgi:hypothetical protein